MSLTDLIHAYLWFVLTIACVVIVRRLTTADFRHAWRDLKSSWRELTSVNERQRLLEQDFRHMKAWLEGLLRSGIDGAFVVIHHRESDRLIRFCKYIRAAGDYGLELRFPNAAWSKEYFRKFLSYCEENATPYRIHAETSGETLEFLCVNCEKDLDLAFEITKVIWTRIFDLPETAQHRIDSHGISNWDELIDCPDKAPLSFRDGWRHKYGAEPPSFMCILLDLMLTLLLPFAFFGLIITLLNSPPQVPDWSFDLGSLRLRGSSVSLVFFCLYLACILRLGSRKRKPKSSSWLEVKFLPVWRRTVTITLPISSILMWTN